MNPPSRGGEGADQYSRMSFALPANKVAGNPPCIRHRASAHIVQQTYSLQSPQNSTGDQGS